MTSIRTRKEEKMARINMSQNQGNVPAASALSQPRVSSIAGVIALICFLAAGFGSVYLESLGVSETLIIVFAILMSLLGLYLMFAIQIARQWE